MLTLGTRGDVEPYLALGKTFVQQGHEVTLCTGKNFAGMARDYGVGFRPLQSDFNAFLGSETGKKIIKIDFGVRKKLKKWAYPMIYEALHNFYELSHESDKVLFNVKTQADHFADRFPDKMIHANVVPVLEPTNAFVNPAFRSLKFPAFLNKLSYLFYDLSFQLMKSQVVAFRREVGLSSSYERPQLPSIYGISPHFIEKPKDYPDNSFFTGFWSDDSSEPLSDDLVEFLESGDPPLLITFGSMPYDTSLNLIQVIRRIRTDPGLRVILVAGWGISGEDAASIKDDPGIKVIPSAPFDQLFPRVKAIIHHGGAGTTSSCLEAGRPFWNCPVLYPIGDQEFWGTMAYKKGVALKPVPLRKVSEKQFVDHVKALNENKSLYENAENLKKKLHREDGKLNAVRIVENL